MPIKDWKKELWTIPNMLSIFRIILIPIYLYIYLNATQPYHYWLAAAILAISCLTDMIDGKIARRFNMISQVGKVLDPLADKATQFALMVCLSTRRKPIRVLLCLFVVKESFQLLAMILNLRKNKALDGALMAGKVSTTVLFISLIILVMLPELPDKIANGITMVCAVFLLVAFVQYVRAYYGRNKKVHDMEDSQ